MVVFVLLLLDVGENVMTIFTYRQTLWLAFWCFVALC